MNVMERIGKKEGLDRKEHLDKRSPATTDEFLKKQLF